MEIIEIVFFFIGLFIGVQIFKSMMELSKNTSYIQKEPCKLHTWKRLENNKLQCENCKKVFGEDFGEL